MAFYPYDREVFDNAVVEKWEMFRTEETGVRFRYDDDGNLVRNPGWDEYARGITEPVVVIPYDEVSVVTHGRIETGIEERLIAETGPTSIEV